MKAEIPNQHLHTSYEQELTVANNAKTTYTASVKETLPNG